MRKALWMVIAGLALLGAGRAEQKKVLVYGLSPEGIAELRQAAPEARIVPVDRDTVMKEIADADAIIGTISAELVRAGKRLKWAQVPSAGVERYLHLAPPDLRDSDIVLTNCKIIQGPEIADHAFALLLATTRRLPRYLANQREQTWRRETSGLVELNGKTAVVIGVGGIGAQIAVRAKAFGMRVIGVEPKDLPYMPFLDRVVKPDRLDEVLPEADVVFMAAPHTPQTHKMMGTRQFELMKRDSYFVAVSRGKTYDMDALVRALDSQHLAGAGVDVTDPEPLPAGHPLWKFSNVVITPHVAGRSDRVGRRRLDLYKENLQRFPRGEPLVNVVDKQKGY